MENEDPVDGGMPLRKDLRDVHYAQLFFVVGHVSIKMLPFLEL